jgi:hypothetical protein
MAEVSSTSKVGNSITGSTTINEVLSTTQEF